MRLSEKSFPCPNFSINRQDVYFRNILITLPQLLCNSVFSLMFMSLRVRHLKCCFAVLFCHLSRLSLCISGKMCVSCCVAPNRQGPHLTLKVCWGTRLGSKRSFCVCLDSELLISALSCLFCLPLAPGAQLHTAARLTSSQKYEADSRS